MKFFGKQVLFFFLMSTLSFAQMKTLESAHYRLFSEIASPEAEEHLKILEAAFHQFHQFFQAPLPLKKGEKLVGYIFQNKSDWEKKLKEDKAKFSTDMAGFYWSTTKTFYLYRQPTIYYTRCLLLHEAAHQYHYLACTKNTHLTFEWYIEGIATFLSMHHWDGKELQLGVIPEISIEDYPSESLKKMTQENLQLEDIFSGKTKPGYPVYWSMMAFLLKGEKRKYEKLFWKLAKELDRSSHLDEMKSLKVIKKYLGAPQKFQGQFLEWLKQNQQPFTPVFNEWVYEKPRQYQGISPNALTCCFLKSDCSSFSATLVVPENTKWRAGLILSFTSKEEYILAWVESNGRVSIDRREADGRWINLHQEEKTLPQAKEFVFEGNRTENRVSFFISGEKIAVIDTPTKKMGLVLENGTIIFRNIQWKP